MASSILPSKTKKEITILSIFSLENTQDSDFCSFFGGIEVMIYEFPKVKPIFVIFWSVLKPNYFKKQCSHTGRNRFNLFQISFSANTADAHSGVSGVSKDQKFCEKFKNTHCQVDHQAKME